MITNEQYNIVYWLDRARADDGRYSELFRCEGDTYSFVFAADGYRLHAIFESNIEAQPANENMTEHITQWLGLADGHTLEKVATIDPLDVLSAIEDCLDGTLWCNFFGTTIAIDFLRDALDSFTEPIGMYTNSETSEGIPLAIAIGELGKRCALIMPSTVLPEDCKFQYPVES